MNHENREIFHVTCISPTRSSFLRPAPTASIFSVVVYGWYCQLSSSDPSALPASAASPRAAFTSITPGDGLLLASSAVRRPVDAARSFAVVRRARHFLSAEFSTVAVQIIFFSSGGSGVSSGRYVDLASPLNGSNFVLKPLAPHAQLQIQIQVQSCVRV